VSPKNIAIISPIIKNGPNGIAVLRFAFFVAIKDRSFHRVIIF